LKKTKLLYNDNKIRAKSFVSINPVVAEILLNRGFKTEEQMHEFMEKKVEKNYGELKGIKEAARIIGESIKEEEVIVIYSDTDADGCMSAALGIKLLSKVTKNAYYYTNNRFIDGYGLCKNGIDIILDKFPGTKLIITADNGVAAMDIAYAKEKGLKVVVTDHHEPPEVLPPADVIVDAKQKDCPYKFKELCGAGILYKVLRETYKYLGRKEEEADIVLDLVAFATIGDIVPIVKENRIIVNKGAKMINDTPSLAFQVIKEVLEIKEISPHNEIAYLLVPMINALSRVGGTVNEGIELFISEDKDRIKEIVLFMKEQNDTRKKMTKDETEKAEKLIQSPLDEKIIIICDDGFSEGIVGIVAGRLKEEYNRPAIVLTNDENDKNLLKGSSRSIEGFHLKEVFEQIQNKYHIFETFGGHAKAAGLSIKRENLEKLKELLYIEANKLLSEDDLQKTVKIDAALISKELTLDLFDEIEKLGPFGEGFPEPIMAINFDMTDIYSMGTEKQHLKCYDRFTDTSVICWNGAVDFKKLLLPRKKAVGKLTVNEFKNKKSMQFIVKDNLIF